MLAQSITGHIINSIAALVRGSFLAAFLIRVCARLKADFDTSCLYKLLMRVCVFLKNQYDVSFVKSFINSGEPVQKKYQSSLLCGLVCFAGGLAVTVCGRIFAFAERISSGGIVHYVLNRRAVTFHGMFALMIALMLICPHEMWNNLYALIFALGFGFWYLARVYAGKESADFGNINFGLVVFILFATLISAISYAQKDALRIMLFVYTAVIFCLLMGKAVNTEEKLMRVLKIICTAVAVTSVFGIAQRFMGIEVNPEYVDVNTSGDMPGRIFSTFANPNNFAELLVLFMPLTAALVMVLKSYRQKAFFTLCFVLDIVAIGMSYSRSCWVALALSLLVMLLVYDWRLLVPLGFVVLIAIPFLPDSILDRILSTGSLSDSSNSYRLYIWTGALRMVRSFFVSGLGAGPANFTAYYRPLAEFRAITAPHSHMIYMELIIEFGIFAAIGFFGYFVSVMKKALAGAGKTNKTFKAVLGASAGSMVGMLFVCAAEYVWFYPRDMFVFWIVLGIISAATTIAVKQAKS